MFRNWFNLITSHGLPTMMQLYKIERLMKLAHSNVVNSDFSPFRSGTVIQTWTQKKNQHQQTHRTKQQQKYIRLRMLPSMCLSRNSAKFLFFYSLFMRIFSQPVNMHICIICRMKRIIWNIRGSLSGAYKQRRYRD